MKRFLICAALIVWSGLASAVVYKWVDGQGKIQYGDRPPDGVKAEVVEMLGNRAPRTVLARPVGPATASQSAAAPKNPMTKDADKQAVDQDVSQSRDKQCTEAQERYKKLIEGRKLYKTGADGERQYLSSEEIDQQRLDAKRDIDSICNSPT